MPELHAHDEATRRPSSASEPLRHSRKHEQTEGSVLHLLATVMRDVVRYRELLQELTLRDLRIRYKQSVLGVVWAVVTPLVVVLAGAIFKVAFASLAGRSVSPVELGGLAVKSIGWTFFIGAIGFGTSSLTANLSLITKVYFPRELLPLSTTLTQAIDSAIGAVALIILFPLFGVGHIGGIGWLVVLSALLAALTVAASLLAACANVYFRDVRHIVQLVTSFGIFFTPVFFDLDAFGARGARAFSINPLTGLLEGARLAFVTGHDLLVPLRDSQGAVVWSPWFLAYSATVAILGLAASTIIFRRAAARFADIV